MDPCLIPGSRIIGGYRVFAPLAVGGKAVTYHVEHPQTGGGYAMKLPTVRSAADEPWKKRFEREVDILTRLAGPCFPTLFGHGRYECGSVKDIPYIVTGLPRGERLSEIITRRKLEGARPDVTFAVALLRHLGTGLSILHAAGAIHRNLKPDRIAVLPTGEAQMLDLLLGLGALHRGVTGGHYLGTPEYNSPEQIQDASNVDGRSDLYSLGLIVQTFLLGEHPLGPSESARDAMFRHVELDVMPVSQRFPQVPVNLTNILVRLTRRDPAERYQTAAEMVDELARAFPVR